MRVLLPWLLAPLTLNVSARDGFDGMECASAGGVKPGSGREELLIVPADRDRQILQLPRPQLLTHLGAVGLQQRLSRAETVTVSWSWLTPSAASTRATLLSVTARRCA